MVLKFFKDSFQAVKKALGKARSFFSSKLHALFSGPINEEMAERLEELFYEADFGVATSRELSEKARQFLRKHPETTSAEVCTFLSRELLKEFAHLDFSLKKSESPNEPTVILVIGTNGNGKTTFIAKLAKRLKDEGHSVLLAAGDTFRAAAQEQLKHWAEKLQVEIVSGQYAADPAAIVFDALTAAKARGVDYVLIDTAGRLENKTHLMKELEKMKRAGQKVIPNTPHETLLVLDATIGQNGITYAKTFREFVPITGLVLTKVDGSAKGGTAINIQKELQIPVKFLGTGESAEDLHPFEAESFVQSLFFD